jgi:hypothetical protein
MQQRQGEACGERPVGRLMGFEGEGLVGIEGGGLWESRGRLVGIEGEACGN